MKKLQTKTKKLYEYFLLLRSSYPDHYAHINCLVFKNLESTVEHVRVHNQALTVYRIMRLESETPIKFKTVDLGYEPVVKETRDLEERKIQKDE